jgi:hypothetical protein
MDCSPRLSEILVDEQSNVVNFATNYNNIILFFTVDHTDASMINSYYSSDATSGVCTSVKRINKIGNTIYYLFE